MLWKTQFSLTRKITDTKRFLDPLSSKNTTPQTAENPSSGELMELVAELPTGFRTVFNLFVVEGYNHKEIGEMLGITESTSRSQLTRAKKWLQKRISEL